MTKAKLRRLNVALLGVACWVWLSSSAWGQESIQLKNVMNSPVLVLLQPEQNASPYNIRLLVDETRTFKLTEDGPYTIQVVPDDQPNSGYSLGPLDLRQLAKNPNNNPLRLRGHFAFVLDEQAGVIRQERVGVSVDVHHLQGIIMVRLGVRLYYEQAMSDELQQKPEPMPTATTAVVSVIVPPHAKLTIDGKPTTSTGRLRHFETPPLEQGRTFQYRLHIEWLKDGHECKASHDVDVQAGQVSRVYFKLPIDPNPGMPPGQ